MFSSAKFAVDADPVVQLFATNPKRQYVAITNEGTNEVALGGEGVTYTTGFILAAGAQPFVMELSQFNRAVTGSLYAVCNAAESATVSVLIFTRPDMS